ncbi:MAG TPA: heavy metal translocating P-type ATPase [Candidatus Dormibacteraeota bacterium]|jgi:Cu2+-exporting ATPase|nr:heavy metal translocating P-type ATPase [Candidatus Dormibacteraeota bacterium]
MAVLRISSPAAVLAAARPVHATRTRVRLRVDGAAAMHIPVLLDGLAAHPAVREVSWRSTSRSLVLWHDGSLDVDELLANPPDAPRRPPARDGHQKQRREHRDAPAHSLLREMAVPAAALSAGAIGLTPFSVPVIAACALPIARRALRHIGRRRLSIDVLDATATTLLLGTGDLLAAGVTVALVETGERIRTRARGQARRVLRTWMSDDARGVRVLRDGTEPRMPMEEVVPGERAVVYAGETVPVDGVIETGEALVDQRAWTGEPMPRPLRAGDSVLAGSTVLDGRLVIEVLASGEETRAGRLAAALEDAIAADTRVSDMARRIADRFVAPVLLTGGVVLLATGDVARLASMLIVDFGTGVRISVPTSILSTMVAGARQQVLFRSGAAVERLSCIDTVVFDKTGTLTTGRPSVAGVMAAAGFGEDEILALAAAAEGHLPHPLARAVRRAARRRGLDVPEPEQVRYRSGGGVTALIGGRRVVVGTRALLDDEGVAAPTPERTSSSVVMVAVDGVYAGRIRLQDRVRPDARAVIDDLRTSGVCHVWLATGDRAPAARAVARHLGLDGWTAQMMPEDKVSLVRRLRAEGRRVAVVGDGINDAAAMAEADVGVAVGEGAELAREAADVVLHGEGIETLVVAVRLARQAMGLVRQNVVITAAPNAAAMGMAVVGALPPLAAAVVNNGSTLVAAANGLRPLLTGTPERPTA